MTTTPKDVLLYVPNLIGYARVILTLSSFGLLLVIGNSSKEATASSWYWIFAIVMYLGSFVGDLLDGWAARKLQQTSTFGGVLDMVTDRCSTMGFLFIVGDAYRSVDEDYWGWPVCRGTCLALVLLDISSHWCQMYASLSGGQHHHKSSAGNQNRHFLVRWFYQYYWFFGYLCVGAEFTYILLLVHHYMDSDDWRRLLVQAGLVICAPGCLAKQVVNVAQLLSSCHAIAQQDAQAKNENKQR